MSKKGQDNQRGIFAQNWAAISLFLQFLRDPNYSYIRLEPDNSEDFILAFKDGKNIVCESKFRKRRFGRTHLRELLHKIINKQAISDRDEILVICKSVEPNLVSDTKNIRFFDELKNKYKKHAFDDQMLDLLPRVNFWILAKDFNKQNNYSLLSELINMWLPSADIVRFTDSILQSKIFSGSTSGGLYSRDNFDKDIEDFKREVQSRSDYFNNKVKKEKQFMFLENEIKKGKGVKKWGTGSISALSAQWDLTSFAMERLKKSNSLDLKQWDDLWRISNVSYSAHGIFNIFENNLSSVNNKLYILKYIHKNINNFTCYYRDDLFIDYAIRLVKKIILLPDSQSILPDAFAIAQKLIKHNQDELFYLKDRGYHRKLYENSEIVDLINEIYVRADRNLKESVINLIFSCFNLVEDDGQFSHYSPPIVFEVLRKWLDEGFINRFNLFVSELSEQYDRFYKRFGRKVSFKGWELMGGITAYEGGNYHITDRHFINYILEPAIRSYYEAEPEAGWKFIKKHCINKQDKVSKIKPDFLNRSVYKIVLDRYASDDSVISEEAFEVLKGFIMYGKGIPNKAELIYQAVAGSDLPDEKKWSLVAITFPKYDVPLSSFVERIVTSLAKRGMEKAKNELKKWLLNPKYYKRFMFELESTPITELLDTDLDLAIELFKDLITSDYVSSDRKDAFGAYDVAALLHKILIKDYQKGLSIIRLLESLKTLSYDQQIIYSYSLFQHYGNDDSDDPSLLLKVYQDVVDPFLNKHENKNINVCQRLPKAICREAFVKFAARLAAKKEIEKALRIIQVFKSDPDPYLPGNDPDDSKDEFNEHKNILDGKETNTITSVRGNCGWVLMKCSTLYGREHIPQIIALTDELINDENWYVKQMASFALSQLARNRLTVLPDNKDVLFFGKDPERALRNAKQVEAIAFNLLKSVAEASDNVKNALAKSVLSVFGHIRALNMHDALCLVNAFKDFPHEAIAEAAPLFIYFAEFRKDGFKDWKWPLPGLYDDLGPEKYDDGKFKDILLETIDKIEPEKRFSFAAQFEHVIRTLSNNEKDAQNQFEMAFYYLDYLSKEYSHEVFRMIYTAIKEGLEKGLHTDKLLGLYFKCLRKEGKFYNSQLKEHNIQRMYWWPSRHNESILSFIYSRDKTMFLDAFKIIVSFPKDFYIHDSNEVISLLDAFSKTNKKAKALVKQLFDRNPSKYYNLKNEWFSKKTK